MRPEPIPTVDPELQDLLDLCLNNLDGYSVVLFVADREGAPLKVRAFQTLSRNLNPAARIGPGEGLVGWVYKHRQSVNTQQLDDGPKGLLFYRTDENIKSFMALPLGNLPAVLAIDSKQKYIFSDKSAKLLFQFGQTIEKAWRRLAGAPNPQSAEADGAAADARPAGRPDPSGSFWRQVETLLARPDHEGGGLRSVLEAARRATGFRWAFLTALLPGDQKNYHIIGSAPDFPAGLSTPLPLASGLAGWVHAKGQPLALDKIKADGQHSYVFHKDEPLREVGSFHGWPLFHHQSPRGALLLAGGPGQTLDGERAELMACLALRLGAQLQHDRLIGRVLELSRLDSQTGLPHRSYFTERLARLMELCSVAGDGTQLFVLAVSGLGAFSRDNGQEAARELLRSIAQELLGATRPSWELGHISYGVFTLAMPAKEAEEAQKALTRFKKRLEDWPLAGRSGRASLGLFPATGTYPRNAKSPEEFLEVVLTTLAEQPGE